MKKNFALFLVVMIGFLNISPSFAYQNYYEPQNDTITAPTADSEVQQQEETKTFITSVEEEKVYLVPKSVYKLEFESDFDVNETNPNDEIFFRLLSPVQVSNGMYLPEHTRFSGKFKKLSSSKPLFKRARAYIIIDKILLPNENSYTLRMEPKKGSDLKSPQILNVLRAIPASVGIVTFSVLSVATVAIESVTIVGLVVVPRTCKGFGLLISSMAKGLNYKAKAGSVIEFKLDTPVYVNTSDLR